MKLFVNEKKCPKNHRCPAMKVCPVGAITQEGFRAPTINEKLCIKCGKCSKFCPKGALTLTN